MHDYSEVSLNYLKMATETLLKTCKCAVCLQVLAFPVTWSCGHSFCKDCTAGVVLEIQDNRGRIKCPECRKFANRASLMRFATNTVLQFLLENLFAQHLNKARLEAAKRSFNKYAAQLKGPCAENGFAGENGGKHSRGWEVLKTESFELHSADVRGSRNIVRDEADYAMHICLAPISSLQFIPSTKKNDLRNWFVRFCLLEMEEDEAEEGGFPISIHEHTNTEHQDMSLIRNSFEGTLHCRISQNKQVLAELQSDCIQGITEFYVGRAVGSEMTLLPNSTVTIEVYDEDSGCQYKIQFKLSSLASQNKLSHLRRTISKRSSREGEGESLDSDEDEEEDEDDDRGSLDDFIVSDGSPTPQTKRQKRQRVHTVSDSDKDEESDDEIPEEDEEILQIVRNKASKKVIDLSDSDESELELAKPKSRTSAKNKKSNRKPVKVSSSEEDSDDDEDEEVPRRQTRIPQLKISDDSDSISDDEGETLRRHIRKLRQANSDDDEEEEECVFENGDDEDESGDDEEAEFGNEYRGRTCDSDEDEEEEL